MNNFHYFTDKLLHFSFKNNVPHTLRHSRFLLLQLLSNFFSPFPGILFLHVIAFAVCTRASLLPAAGMQTRSQEHRCTHNHSVKVIQHGNSFSKKG
jgi:hypothetical protein